MAKLYTRACVFLEGRAKCERFFQRKIGVYQSRKVRGTKKHNYTKTRLVNFGHIQQKKGQKKAPRRGLEEE